MKILLAVDGSKHATAAALKCCEIISFGNDSEIKIVSVADVSSPVSNAPFGVTSEYSITINSELSKMAESFVVDAKRVVKENLRDDVKVETEVLSGSPKIEIVEAAEKWGADLITVGSHGYGFFERMLIGSVSDAILHHAPCSVLVVKTEDTDNSKE